MGRRGGKALSGTDVLSWSCTFPVERVRARVKAMFPVGRRSEPLPHSRALSVHHQGPKAATCSELV